ncbi:polyphosphate polymerase domain-containing protein [Microbacterium paulum]
MSTYDADHALDALSLLDTVDLAGLNAEAELQTRVDRKYLVPLSDLAGVIDALPAGTRVLDLGGERSFRYASQYFDTPRLDSYFGAVHGRRRRFKVRARSYLDSGGAFLEVKTRGARSATVKERVPVSLDATADALDDDAVSYATELLTDAGIPGAAGLATALAPVLVTRYRRTTLLLPASDDSGPSRGTIDTELLWLTGTGEGGRMLRLPNRVIVETKSGQRAGALDRELLAPRAPPRDGVEIRHRHGGPAPLAPLEPLEPRARAPLRAGINQLCHRDETHRPRRRRCGAPPTRGTARSGVGPVRHRPCC